ncbi:MAG: hypothetical protein ACXW6T_27275, partial [Candidatus Binatia bacterium]
DQDQARLIAERVARRVAGTRAGASSPGNAAAPSKNGAPVREELSAIREGLHDLESKLDRIESKIVHSANQPAESTRARLIDFVSSGPPVVAAPSVASSPPVVSEPPSQFVPPTQSPWLAPMSSMYRRPTQQSAQEISPSEIRNSQLPSHPSQERFGVEEATVAELVEFFENEKKCSVEPGGKPCDHCSMCSSRGF